MADISIKTANILRDTIAKLETTSDYQWGHMGSCNCGHLAQVISKLSKSEIHQRAMQRYGDWNEQLNDYCESSGYPIDEIISQLTSNGFAIEDLKNLERLSDPQILTRIDKTRRDTMRRNSLEDVILYLTTWVELIEDQIVSNLKKEAFAKTPSEVELT